MVNRISRLGRGFPALIGLLMLMMAAPVALGHSAVTEVVIIQPGQSVTAENAVEAEDPRESLAFYGEIPAPGLAAVYTFRITEEYNPQAQLLVPVTRDDRYRGFSSRLVLVGPGLPQPPEGFPFVLPEGAGIMKAEPPKERSVFHEPFSHTDYHTGPTLSRLLASPGRYYLLVYAPEQAGAYSLSIGKEERILNVFRQVLMNMPQLEQIFFADGALPLRSQFGLSSYHAALLAVMIFFGAGALLAGNARGWRRPGQQLMVARPRRFSLWRRLVLAVTDGLLVLTLATLLLFLWGSLLPTWFRWLGSVLAIPVVLAVAGRPRQARLLGLAWALILIVLSLLL